ncbi:hypothetical protein BJV78DRAFT_222654 [Lactifluus subvellereus]|nr:hypothetical protein BJV78DRAFT_222654 [Lactifluus subvellereus]
MSMAMGMGMGMDMNPNHNIPFPTAVGHMGLQGHWGASAAAPFGNSRDNLTMHNLLNSGPGANFTNGMNMNMGMGMGMIDPRVFAAHQQAMLYAKQTYQLAVAHQAMRDAADEWERGSAISGWGGGSSSVGTSSVLGMGMGLNMNMNMNNMNMNMGGLGTGGFSGAASSLGLPNAGGMGWSTGGMAGHPGGSARSMFGGGMYAASEIGGGSDRGGTVGWSTNSVYGESFGAPRDRSLRGVRQNQIAQMSASGGGGGGGAASAQVAKREGGRPRTRTAPSNGAGQRVVNNAGVKKRGEGYGLVGAVSPPSSWKGPS